MVMANGVLLTLFKYMPKLFVNVSTPVSNNRSVGLSGIIQPVPALYEASSRSTSNVGKGLNQHHTNIIGKVQIQYMMYTEGEYRYPGRADV